MVDTVPHPDQPAREEMVRTMCAAVDAGHPETFGSYFSEDAYYRFGNDAPIRGRVAVVAATAGVSMALPRVRHRIDQIAHIGPQMFCRFTIETQAPDGRPVAMPCVTVIEIDGKKIVDYRVYIDLSPALRNAPSGTFA